MTGHASLALSLNIAELKTKNSLFNHSHALQAFMGDDGHCGFDSITEMVDNMGTNGDWPNNAIFPQLVKGHNVTLVGECRGRIMIHTCYLKQIDKGYRWLYLNVSTMHAIHMRLLVSHTLLENILLKNHSSTWIFETKPYACMLAF